VSEATQAQTRTYIKAAEETQPGISGVSAHALAHRVFVPGVPQGKADGLGRSSLQEPVAQPWLFVGGVRRPSLFPRTEGLCLRACAWRPNAHVLAHEMRRRGLLDVRPLVDLVDLVAGCSSNGRGPNHGQILSVSLVRVSQTRQGLATRFRCMGSCWWWRRCRHEFARCHMGGIRTSCCNRPWISSAGAASSRSSGQERARKIAAAVFTRSGSRERISVLDSTT
jgi:hypothetical protein